MGTVFLTAEQPELRGVFNPIGPQFVQQMFGQDCLAILTSLTLFNPDHHPRRVAFDMFWFEPNGLPAPESGSVDGLEHDPMLEVVVPNQLE